MVRQIQGVDRRPRQVTTVGQDLLLVTLHQGLEGAGVASGSRLGTLHQAVVTHAHQPAPRLLTR